MKINFYLKLINQLEPKCQSEPVEDFIKEAFRQAQCDN